MTVDIGKLCWTVPVNMCMLSSEQASSIPLTAQSQFIHCSVVTLVTISSVLTSITLLVITHSFPLITLTKAYPSFLHHTCSDMAWKLPGNSGVIHLFVVLYHAFQVFFFFISFTSTTTHASLLLPPSSISTTPSP